MPTAVSFLAILGLLGGAPDRDPFRHVIVVSVDGLRSDALLADPSGTPAFARLLAGSGTLNARTDPASTVTLPNHAGMLTGRLSRGEDGHGWVENLDPEPGVTLHSRGPYVAGAFDVAHDAGVRTALLASKTKFVLFDRSWNGEHGAPDRTGEDDGRDKLDRFQVLARADELADAALEFLEGARGGRSLVFLHFSDLDAAGHAYGWDLTRGSPYLQAVARVDRALGRLLERLEQDPAFRGRTALILTADHGGGAPHRNHVRGSMWVNYVIPFLVWRGEAAAEGHSGEPGAELYTLNPGRRQEPALGRPAAADGPGAPIRNSDAANLALALMGLPAVPGSRVNRAQDLALEPRE